MPVHFGNTANNINLRRLRKYAHIRIYSNKWTHHRRTSFRTSSPFSLFIYKCMVMSVATVTGHIFRFLRTWTWFPWYDIWNFFAMWMMNLCRSSFRLQKEQIKLESGAMWCISLSYNLIGSENIVNIGIVPYSILQFSNHITL